MKLFLACLLLFVGVISAKVYLEEKFDDTWESRWTVSDWKKSDDTAGEWKLSSGKYNPFPEDKGLQTGPDARFFAISSKLPEEFDNKGKTLVFQFQIKHEQKIDCGGGYIKLLEGDVDQKKFSGDTPYSIMFGPDICGYNKRVHAIITHEGKNLLMKKEVECETDELSHVYTFIIHPNDTYQILIDNEEKSKGSLYDEWDFVKPKKIKDPSAKKPSDWVDAEFIDDPEDKKPEGHDDIPKEIVDSEAKKPDDWNDEEDGEWEAPLIPNPEFKGRWKPKQIKNPEYKGKWKAPLIDNPDYVEKKDVYILPTLKYVGIEIWQVKAGTIFDNMLLTDDPEYAKKFAEDTWGKLKDGEKKLFDDDEKKREAENEEKKSDEDGEGEDGEDGDGEGDGEEPPEDEQEDEPEDEPEEDSPEGHDEL